MTMTTSKYGSHYSVMKNDVLALLEERFSKKDNLLLGDLTFGAGGHTFAMAEEFPNSKVISFDQDPDAIKNGTERIKNSPAGERVELLFSNFNNFSQVIEEDQLFDAILLDAGVSSHQFDTGERGFSFRFDGPLDMRMNPTTGISAEEIINEWDEAKITELIFKYGEDKCARQIAKSIIEKRKEERITRTKQLEEICFHAYPKKMRHAKIHPATKTFQALRIEVNNELGVLEDIVEQVVPKLRVGGLFMVITFHSLEDRIIKHAFKTWNNDEYPIRVLTKKPILPSSTEIFENSRSRSAKLRVLERVNEWPSKNKYPRKE